MTEPTATPSQDLSQIPKGMTWDELFNRMKSVIETNPNIMHTPYWHDLQQRVRAGFVTVLPPTTDKTFAAHTLGTTAKQKVDLLRKLFSDLKAAIEASAPMSRERSIALAELETSCMWAVKAVTHNDPESTPEV